MVIDAQKALEKVMVNVADLHWAARGGPAPTVYTTLEELTDATLKSQEMFPHTVDGGALYYLLAKDLLRPTSQRRGRYLTKVISFGGAAQ